MALERRSAPDGGRGAVSMLGGGTSSNYATRWRWATSLADVSRALKGDGRKTGRCPVHADRSPSLSVGEGRDGTPLAYCHAGCDGRDVLAELRRLGFIVRDGEAAGRATTQRRASFHARESERDDRPEYDDEARRLWCEGYALPGTPGEAYLRARGLDPDKMLSHPPGWPETLRWHRGIGAMLVAVNHARTSLVAAVHRIYVNADGSPVISNDGKKKKLALGPIRGNAAMFKALPDERGRWGIAEGVEDALAATQVAGFSVWAAISATNMARVAPPHWARQAFVFADHDDKGLEAAAKALVALRDRGLEPRVLRVPTPGADPADLVGRCA